jgi:hypothetical protein
MMVEALNFDLFEQLINHIVAFDNIFRYFFNSINGIRCFMNCLKDATKFTLSQWFQKLKVIY